MKLASLDRIGFVEKNVFRWFRLRKRVRQWVLYRPGREKTILFIAGCQRSGTSMMSHLFRLDWDCVTFDELSPLSSISDSMRMRWRPLPEVRDRVMRERAPLVVTKPLVESQNLDRLLDGIPGSRAVWIFRPFRDVARSNVAYFGPENSHEDVRGLLSGETDDWRAQGLDPSDQAAVARLYRATMAPEDAAALFWFARNSLYFSRGFDRDDRIRLCLYDDLVADPSRVMRQVYGFLGRAYPGDRILGDVFGDSKGRGRTLELDPAVDELCRGLLDRMMACSRFGGGR